MELLHTLWRLVLDLVNLLVNVLQLGLFGWLVIVWVAWWTLAVDWRKAWAWLRQGAWVPLVLLMVVAALVWSRLDPRPLDWQVITVANFWWQLAAVGVLVALTLLCGWVQGLVGWYPPEIDLEPPADEAHAPGHAHH